MVNALFCDHEDTNSYFLLMQVLLRRRGIPLALYTDRHPVFKHKSEYQPAGTPTQSLFSINVRLTVRQKCHLFGLRWYQMATLWMRPGTDASADSQRQRIS